MSGALPLHDGARIGIIGGGPAGSFFAHFCLQYARQAGLRLEVVLFDGKPFARRGPAGCNMCAGVVAESLSVDLEEIGIELGPPIVQESIVGYHLITPSGTLRLTGFQGKRGIRTVFRGNGPRGYQGGENISFDDHLLRFVQSEGVSVRGQYVSDIELPGEGRGPAHLVVGQEGRQQREPFDLVVGAFGLNSRLLRRVQEMEFGYRPPQMLRSLQAELMLGHDAVRTGFGDYIHVFALRVPGVKFASITPKHDYVSLTLIGEQVDISHLRSFIDQPLVRMHFPPTWELPRDHCFCRPLVSASSTHLPFTDRLVLVGDASESRLYKNGLDSAFITARAAAATSILHGVSRKDFAQYYGRACAALRRDSLVGRLLFWLDTQVSRHHSMQATMIAAAEHEQRTVPKEKQVLNQVLWSILTGDRPYRSIFLQAFNPRLQFHLLQGLRAAVSHGNPAAFNPYADTTPH